MNDTTTEGNPAQPELLESSGNATPDADTSGGRNERNQRSVTDGNTNGRKLTGHFKRRHRIAATGMG
jgi:hypothetical protein